MASVFLKKPQKKAKEKSSTSDESCDVRILNLEKVKNLRERKPSSHQLQEVSSIFRVLGDSHRAEILFLLAEEELCVCDLAAVIGLSESATSHHLRILRNLRLVRFRKKGKTVLYQLDDHHVSKLIQMGLDHVNERPSS